MTVFISHAFADEADFANVTDALDGQDVRYWRPTDIKSGDSLREQLRVAIRACGVCVFVATHQSVRSSWCGAELGAFWGAGIPIVVYLADSSLADEALPPILQGDVWERRLTKVAVRAGELVRQTDARPESMPATARISSMTVGQLETRLERLLIGAMALVRADEKQPGVDGDSADRAAEAASQVIRAADATEQLSGQAGDEWRRQILWVDDRPGNNVHERGVFESLGFTFTLATSTREALDILETRRFGAIISDMGRVEGPQEGYVLLESIRAEDPDTPFFIYASSNAPAYKRMALDRGAQGSTSRPTELVDMVTGSMGTAHRARRPASISDAPSAGPARSS